jgi:hypothetical protein
MAGAGGQCSCDMALPNPFHYIIHNTGCGAWRGNSVVRWAGWGDMMRSGATMGGKDY